MYGVVLWSDQAEQKAVIWCEDQGDLAYYGGQSTSIFDGPSLDAGDLVHFQIEDGAHMRLAQNPELVSESHAPTIAQKLRAAMSGQGHGAGHSKGQPRRTSNIVPFPMVRTA